MKTAAHILSAIENGGLDATSERQSGVHHPVIVLLIKEQAFCRLVCLSSGSPTAEVVDGNVVRISPSPGIRDGFKITCETVEIAIAIADAFQDLIDDEYAQLFRGK